MSADVGATLSAGDEETTMKQSFWLCVVAAGCSAVVGGCATASGGSGSLEDLLPKPAFTDGWEISGNVSAYDRDSVFDYIDGEAELYFPYGFEAVVTATYAHDGNMDDAVTADVYVMGSLLDAFGIYSNYRPAKADLSPVGGGGHCDGYQLMFYQDRYFVRLSASGKPEQNRPVLLACAQAVLKKLPAGATQPKELKLLQCPSIVPGTEKYIAESLLGYAFFKRGLIAEVHRARGSLARARADAFVRAFVVFGDSSAGAADTMAKYLAYLQGEGVALGRVTVAGGDAIAVKDPLYKGTLVIQSGDCLLGVIGLPDPAQGIPVLEQLCSRVPAR